MPTVTTPSGTKVAYDVIGETGGPALLLIQGLGAQLVGWRQELCDDLAARGLMVVRFDNRDAGLSQRAEGPYGLHDMADDAAGLLTALGIRSAHVVGQSMGGMIAQHLAARHPGMVASLVLLYTSHSARFLTGADVVARRLDTDEHPSRRDAVARYVADEEACASTAYPQDVEWLAHLGGLMFDRGYHPAGVARQTRAVMADPDRSTAVSRIDVPTTIIHGTADRLIAPTASEALHELIPGSVLRVFPGMGHELPRALWPRIVDLIVDNVDRSPLGRDGSDAR